MTIHVLNKFTPKTDMFEIDVTSAGNYSNLSPFYLGPVQLYDLNSAMNVENAWQYSKVYGPFADDNGDPTNGYFMWAKTGWDKAFANRYPMGKGAVPLYSYWAGQKLDYIAARKIIYAPLYSHAVRYYQALSFEFLLGWIKGYDLVIKDYDAYDHRALGYSWDDVINDPERKMGHGFVLAMMLERYL